MAAQFSNQIPSVDYFSLNRRSPELRKTNAPPSAVWGESPSSDPALQSPSSEDSLADSPVSPYTQSFAKPSYALPSQQTSIDPKTDLSSQYSSSFEDWMRWDDSADNTLYPEVKPEYYTSLKVEPSSPVMEALELSGGLGLSNMSSMLSSGLDDISVAFQEDSTIEEPLFQTPANAQSQRSENIYSNSLQWPPTQPSLRPTQPMNAYSSLRIPESSKLMSMAMPKQTEKTSPITPHQSDNRKKRKSTSSASTSSSSSSTSSNPPPRRQSAPVKKTAHNMIEKRYRTNLNDKIAALRDSVPSLRGSEKKDFNGDHITQGDLSGLDAAQKLNKATILSKATEYIAHLEKRNNYLSKECQILKDRVDAFEILIMSQSDAGVTNHPQHSQNKARWKQQHTRSLGS